MQEMRCEAIISAMLFCAVMIYNMYALSLYSLEFKYAVIITFIKWKQLNLLEGLSIKVHSLKRNLNR